MNRNNSGSPELMAQRSHPQNPLGEGLPRPTQSLGSSNQDQNTGGKADGALAPGSSVAKPLRVEDYPPPFSFPFLIKNLKISIN